MLLGAAKLLSAHKSELRGTVVFLFQPAEEGVPEREEGGAPANDRGRCPGPPKVEALYGCIRSPKIQSEPWVGARARSWRAAIPGI